MIVVVTYMKADIDARVHPVAVERRYQKWLLMNKLTNFLAHANQTEFDSKDSSLAYVNECLRKIT
jgi:hypothetical protein